MEFDIDYNGSDLRSVTFPTGYGWSHRLSNLHRYVLIETQPYTCLCKLLRRPGVHVFMQIAETVVGSRAPAISFTARTSGVLKRVPATDPRCSPRSPIRRASPLGCGLTRPCASKSSRCRRRVFFGILTFWAMSAISAAPAQYVSSTHRPAAE